MRFTELRKPARPPRTYPVRKRAPPTNRGGRGRSLGPRISCREEHNTTRPSPTHRKTPARKESPGRRTQPGLGKCSRPHARRTVRYPGKVEGRLPRRALCCRIMLSGRAPVYGRRFLPRTLPLGSSPGGLFLFRWTQPRRCSPVPPRPLFSPASYVTSEHSLIGKTKQPRDVTEAALPRMSD
jgi:hypothetical protein